VKVAAELNVLVLDSRNAVDSDDVSQDFIAHTDTKNGSAVIAAGFECSKAPVARPSCVIVLVRDPVLMSA
jgi:hypothetical protein